MDTVTGGGYPVRVEALLTKKKTNPGRRGPKPRPELRRVTVSVRVLPGVRDEIDALASLAGATRSRVAGDLLESAVKAREVRDE